jgi:general stress protein YciG
MANNTSNRGFASSSMSEKAKQEARSKGGQNSSGNFKNDAARASREGKRGNAAEPTEAKKLGGEHSHQNT